MRVFQEALTEILSRLETAKNRRLLRAYALIGGFAVSAWGVPRATNDIDFAVAIGAVDPQALAIFLGGRFEAGEADDPLRGLVHTSIQVGSTSVSLQLIFSPLPSQKWPLGVSKHYPASNEWSRLCLGRR
jgi:hypothetical protein